MASSVHGWASCRAAECSRTANSVAHGDKGITANSVARGAQGTTYAVVSTHVVTVVTRYTRNTAIVMPHHTHTPLCNPFVHTHKGTHVRVHRWHDRSLEGGHAWQQTCWQWLAEHS